MEDIVNKVPELFASLVGGVSGLLMDFKNADSRGKALRLAALIAIIGVTLVLAQAVFG